MTVTYLVKVHILKIRMPHGLSSWLLFTSSVGHMVIPSMSSFMTSHTLVDIKIWQLIKLWQYYAIYLWVFHRPCPLVSIMQIIIIIWGKLEEILIYRSDSNHDWVNLHHLNFSSGSLFRCSMPSGLCSSTIKKYH